jgi:hypothetical protein
VGDRKGSKKGKGLEATNLHLLKWKRKETRRRRRAKERLEEEEEEEGSVHNLIKKRRGKN